MRMGDGAVGSGGQDGGTQEQVEGGDGDEEGSVNDDGGVGGENEVVVGQNAAGPLAQNLHAVPSSSGSSASGSVYDVATFMRDGELRRSNRSKKPGAHRRDHQCSCPRPRRSTIDDKDNLCYICDECLYLISHLLLLMLAMSVTNTIHNQVPLIVLCCNS